jgi:hypothetical protein
MNTIDESRDIAFRSFRVNAWIEKLGRTIVFIAVHSELALGLNNADMLNGGLQRRKVDLDFYLQRVFRKRSFR